MTCVKKIFFTFIFPFSVINAANANQHCPQEFDSIDCLKLLNSQYPLNYNKLLEEETLSNTKVIQYELKSQKYPLNNSSSEAEWTHIVSIYIPKGVVKTNNPILYVDSGNEKKNNEVNFENIAINTASIVIKLAQVPNQPLSFSNAENLSEDQLVAYTWKLYLDNPNENKTTPLHLPMAMSIIRTLDLFQKEFTGTDYRIDKFIVSGASKRGWAAWLATIADQRIAAIIPIVIDIYNINAQFSKLNKVYANHWPVALYPYYKIDLYKFIDTENFKTLMQITDPLAYKNTPKKNQLNIPKYIVSASGDDFFLPDSIFDIYKEIPGINYFRYIPNSSHFVSTNIIENSIAIFANNYNSNLLNPTLNYTIHEVKKSSKVHITIPLNSNIKSISLWEATNKIERDFRYVCGIKYSEKKFTVSMNEKFKKFTITSPKHGWKAAFIEVTYQDGFVQSTPNVILPKEKFPTKIEANKSNFCNVLPLKK